MPFPFLDMPFLRSQHGHTEGEVRVFPVSMPFVSAMDHGGQGASQSSSRRRRGRHRKEDRVIILVL